MRNSDCIALLAFVVSSLVVPKLARADDDQTRRQIFEQAKVAVQAERWEEARASYQRLWTDRHTYDVALQLGLAEYNLKRMRDCAEHLAYGLMLLPPREKPEIGERSRQILSLCKREVGALDLRVKNKGADVYVDRKPVATAPLVTEIFVTPGEHRFEVRLDGHNADAFTIQLEAGQTKTRSVELRPLATTAPAGEPVSDTGARTAPVNAPPPPPEQHASWAPVVAGGILTIAGLSAGVGLQLVRNAREDESASIRSNPSGVDCRPSVPDKSPDCQRLSDLASDYDAYGRLELISFIVGGAALIGTGTYFFVARPDRARSTARSGPLRVAANLTKGSGYLGVIADF